MRKFAVVFPGQGSQSLAMLKDLAVQNAIIQQTFLEASDVLGYDLWSLTQNGPVEKLNQTTYTQPILLTAGVALWRVYFQIQKPAVLAGHSLGEYTALVCANSISFSDALNLVATRGALMQSAVPEGAGAMAAILGLSDAEVNALCQKISKPNAIVSAANYNTLGQVVIAGHHAAVQECMTQAKAAGAKRAILIPVSVPSHCELMKPVSLAFEEKLNQITLQCPEIPVIHNVNCQQYTDLDQIKSALIKQLYSPVYWVGTIQKMKEQGIEVIYECGPGSILTALNKRMELSLECCALGQGGVLCH